MKVYISTDHAHWTTRVYLTDKVGQGIKEFYYMSEGRLMITTLDPSNNPLEDTIKPLVELPKDLYESFVEALMQEVKPQKNPLQEVLESKMETIKELKEQNRALIKIINTLIQPTKEEHRIKVINEKSNSDSLQ